METLCTTEGGRTSVIPEHLFDKIVCKTDNSLFSADVYLASLLGNTDFFGVNGLTTTSCVSKTIDDCRKHWKDKIVVVAADVVGTRKNRTKDGEDLLDQWSDSAEERIIVVPTWRSITHR